MQYLMTVSYSYQSLYHTSKLTF